MSEAAIGIYKVLSVVVMMFFVGLHEYRSKRK
jgi:hypothetical protein